MSNKKRPLYEKRKEDWRERKGGTEESSSKETKERKSREREWEGGLVSSTLNSYRCADFYEQIVNERELRMKILFYRW